MSYQINLIKVRNMRSPRGKEVPNQFIIRTEFGDYFQSYDSLIAYIPNAQQREFGCKVTLDSKYWDYSTTTGKYRNIFLNESIEETRKKIASKEYALDDLNKEWYAPHLHF